MNLLKTPPLTVYTLTFNEEFMLPKFIEHYRGMFPGCRIVIYDNESTDRTQLIAQHYRCEVVLNKTEGKLNDIRYLEIKNNCWKDAQTDWVCVADCDEHLNIDAEQLFYEDENKTTVISSQGWNMVNLKDDLNFAGIKFGVRAKSYDKIYMFKRTAIREINYNPGCHSANIIGKVKESTKAYECFHYKYVNPDFMVARHKVFASRLSDVNIQKGYGGHYLYSEEQIRKEFSEARKNAKQILA